MRMTSRRSVLRSTLAFTLLGGCTAGVTPPRSTLPCSGPPNGSLLVIGGGVPGPQIQAAAIRLGRGDAGTPARWVYVPTATEDRDLAHAAAPDFTTRDDGTVTTLHTRDRGEADSEAFVAPLRSATAVFFGGGRQWRLVDAYAGTRTERELRAVLDRGGLIAGTSAGATIQGSYLVRGAPEGNEIMMAPGHERGFGYITNAAIDQHVLVRGRAADLAGVVAAHDGLLGIGIDESTAVIVRRNRMTVLGRSVVLITDGAAHDGQPFYALTPGTEYDLATRTILG